MFLLTCVCLKQPKWMQERERERVTEGMALNYIGQTVGRAGNTHVEGEIRQNYIQHVTQMEVKVSPRWLKGCELKSPTCQRARVENLEQGPWPWTALLHVGNRVVPHLQVIGHENGRGVNEQNYNIAKALEKDHVQSFSSFLHNLDKFPSVPTVFSTSKSTTEQPPLPNHFPIFCLQRKQHSRHAYLLFYLLTEFLDWWYSSPGTSVYRQRRQSTYVSRSR